MYLRSLLAGTEVGPSRSRAQLLTGARGNVLEIGAGTGANLPFYSDAVTALTCAEPEEPMSRRLARRIATQRRAVEMLAAPAERLPVADAQFDTVVSTLCAHRAGSGAGARGAAPRAEARWDAALSRARALRRDPKVAAWQDRLNGFNRLVAYGCNCNRATVAAIRAAGFTITSLQQDTLPKAPPFVRPLVVGAAES